MYDEDPSTPDEIYLKSLTKVCFLSFSFHSHEGTACSSLRATCFPYIFINYSGVTHEYHQNMVLNISALLRISSPKFPAAFS